TAAAGAQVFSATITYTAGANGVAAGGTIGFTGPPRFPAPLQSPITVPSTATAGFSAVPTSPVSALVPVPAHNMGPGQEGQLVYTEGPVPCFASTQTWAVSEAQNNQVVPQSLLGGSPALQVVQGAPVFYQPANPYLSVVQNALSDTQYMIARDACGNQAISTF